jgi:uncharacterized protein YbaP (TraB family)
MIARAALFLAALVPLAATAQAVSWGPIWEATSSAGKVYIAASTHSNGHRQLTLGPATRRALADSDLIALEKLPAAYQSPIQQSRSEAVAKMMFRPDNSSLLDDIPPEIAARLQAVLTAHEIPERGWELVRKTRTPLVPEVMAVILAKYGDYSIELEHPGGDDTFLRFARDHKIELDEVEGAIVLMTNALSATLPEANAAIARMLDGAEGPRAKQKRGAKLIEALETIYTGDVERIYAAQRREECATPVLAAYCDRVVDGRNAGIAERIDAWVKKGRRPFVAVGALHLAGPASIQKALEKKGYTVRRLD